MLPPVARQPKRPRERCPLCKRMIALYEKGQLYHHGNGERNCPGSGFTPKTLRDHAWKEQ